MIEVISLVATVVIQFRLASAHYDPLLNGTSFSPDIAKAQQEHARLLKVWRHSEPRYQSRFEYSTGSVESSSSPRTCLHFPDDDTLQQLRAFYLQEAGEIGRAPFPFSLPGLASDSDHFRLHVPNVGTYNGVDAAIEYINIADGMKNDRFSTFVASQVVDQTPFFPSRDVLAVTFAQIIMWNRGIKTDVTRIFYEMEFRPCSLSLEGLVYTFDDQSISSFLEQRFANRYLCERIQGFCVGEHQQYDSDEDCTTFLSSLPENDPECNSTASSMLSEVTYSLEGNTSNCRFLHHFMASGNPDVHCPHVGKNGGPDIDEKFKCTPATCRKKEQATQKDQLCIPEWQEEAEVAIVASLPHCLGAISSNKCTIECRQALSQYGLSGYTQSKDASEQNKGLSLRTRTCVCSREIAALPLSSVLGRISFSVGDLLNSCGMDEFVSDTFDPCETQQYEKTSKDQVSWDEDSVTSEEFLKQILADMVKRSVGLQEHTVTFSSESERASKSMIMDLEFVKQLAGKPFHHLLPEIQVTGCPFFHGPIVGSHEQVMGLLQSRQKRSRKYITGGNRDLQIDPEAQPILGSLLDSGSPAHLGLRAVFFDAFPILSKPLDGPYAIVFEDVPEDVLKSFFVGGASGASKESQVSHDLLKYIFKHFFPDASHPFVDELSSLFLQLMPVAEQMVARSALWHAVSGEGIDRLQRVLSRKTARMVEAYFGPEKMEAYVRQTSAGTIEDLSLGLTLQLSIGVTTMLRVATETRSRILVDPGAMIQLFQQNPFRFVLEQLRLLSSVTLDGFAALEQDQDVVLQYQGESVVYRGGQEWKSGSPYAVEYSISTANQDERVFPNPEMFDPSRDLNKTLTFGAPEYAFTAANYGETQGHLCVGHNFVIGFLGHVIGQVFPQDLYYERGYPKVYHVSVVTIWVVAILLLCIGVFTILYLLLAVQPMIEPFMSSILLQVDSDDFEHFSHQSRSRSMTCVVEKTGHIHQLCLRKIYLFKPVRHFPYWGEGRRHIKAGQFLLENVNATIYSGRLTGILGPSGAGKTSLLNVIARYYSSGLLASGTVLQVSSTNSSAGSLDNVAFVHHNYKTMLFEHLTGIENLIIGSIVRSRDTGVSWSDFLSGRVNNNISLIKALRYIVSTMQLGKCLGTIVKNMSSGEQRRLSIAVECLKPSRVVLLDEPLSGLDSVVAHEVVGMLKGMAKKLGKMVVMIVHQPSREIFEALDDLLLMKGGKCVFTGCRTEALNWMHSTSDLVNPADNLITFLSTFAERESYATPKLFKPTPGRVKSRSGLASFSNRFMACTLASWFGLRDFSLFVLLFLAIPMVMFFIAAYNLGPETAPQESIVLIILLVGGPGSMWLQVSGIYRASQLMSYTHMAKHGLYSGVDFAIHLLVYYSILATLMCIAVYPVSLLLSFSEVLTSTMMMEAMAVAVASLFTFVAFSLLCNLLVSKPELPEYAFFAANSSVGSALLVFMGIGWIFSGMLYRSGTTEVPVVYEIIAYMSPQYWAGMAFLVSILDDTMFGSCEETISIFCMGDSFLLNYNVDKMPLIPGFAIWILLASTLVASVAACFVSYKVSSRKLLLVEPIALPSAGHIDKDSNEANRVREQQAPTGALEDAPTDLQGEGDSALNLNHDTVLETWFSQALEPAALQGEGASALNLDYSP